MVAGVGAGVGIGVVIGGGVGDSPPEDSPPHPESDRVSVAASMRAVIDFISFPQFLGRLKGPACLMAIGRERAICRLNQIAFKILRS